MVGLGMTWKEVGELIKEMDENQLESTVSIYDREIDEFFDVGEYRVASNLVESKGILDATDVVLILLK